jgi:hypothetical protein
MDNNDLPPAGRLAADVAMGLDRWETRAWGWGKSAFVIGSVVLLAISWASAARR